MEAQRGVPGR